VIQLLTALKINDNSGATAAKVIRVYNNRKYGVGGDLSLVSIKKIFLTLKFEKGIWQKVF
jgi:ribosomal protein L14